METILSKLASLAPDLSELGFSGTFYMSNSSVTLFGYLIEGGIQKFQTGTTTPIVIFHTLS